MVKEHSANPPSLTGDLHSSKLEEGEQTLKVVQYGWVKWTEGIDTPYFLKCYDL